MNPRTGVQPRNDLHGPVPTPAQHERSPASRFSHWKTAASCLLVGTALALGVGVPLSAPRAQDTGEPARVAMSSPTVPLSSITTTSSISDMERLVAATCGEYACWNNASLLLLTPNIPYISTIESIGFSGVTLRLVVTVGHDRERGQTTYVADIVDGSGNVIAVVPLDRLSTLYTQATVDRDHPNGEQLKRVAVGVEQFDIPNRGRALSLTIIAVTPDGTMMEGYPSYKYTVIPSLNLQKDSFEVLAMR